ncbi:MAG: helix-turn-helix transcriptional regulator, partial [Oligoflexia bacterium]|nr:helix-turn-helix transcriptional regulator [Oligoflexia bacterium]
RCLKFHLCPILKDNNDTLFIVIWIHDYTEKENLLEQIKDHNKKIEFEIQNKTRDLLNINIKLNEALSEKDRYILKSDEYNVTLKNILQELKTQKDEQMLELQKQYNEVVIPLIGKLKRDKSADESVIECLEDRLNEILGINKTPNAISFFKFTVAESKVLKLLQKGFIAKEIAENMHINISTVYKHQNHIRKKLGITESNMQLRSHLQNILFSEGKHL